MARNVKFTVDGRRWDSSKMTCISDDKVETSTGRGRDGVYMTPKSHRVFIDGYTCWEKEEDSWWEADAEEIAALANEYPTLLDLVPEGEY